MRKKINSAKVSLSLILALLLFMTQVGWVYAAPAREGAPPITGLVGSITLVADTITGVTIVNVDITDSDQALQNIRVSLETAITLGLVVLNGDGKPEINRLALGRLIEIEPSMVIPSSGETQHPIGSALATFFSEIEGVDYETIMAAHNQGVGFGVIAQMLWLTIRLEGDAEVFEELVHAKQTGDFSAFMLEDGSTPLNWGQLMKAILDKDKKNSLGIVISSSHHDGNDNGLNNGNGGNSNRKNGEEKKKGNGNGQGKEKQKGKKK
jgi:hypothetical protein